MLFSKIAPWFALSFILLIIATVLALSTFMDLNSYAESHDNNNKNISSSSSLSPSPISNGEELKKSRDVTDVNTSSSPASSSSSSESSSSASESSNETSDDKPRLGTLVVMTQVVNEGGGDKKPSDFTITVSGNNPTPSSFTGSSSGTTVQLSPGKYQVTEPRPTTNYNSTLSNGCSGTIREGETNECTITNTYSVSPPPPPPPPPVTTGKIIVITKVNNEGGGDKKPSDFTITVSGNNPTPSSFAGSSSGTTITVNEGTYNVKEEEGPYISPDYVPGRYTPSYSSECAGTIQAGKTVSCTISNTYNPFIPGILSKLIVTKKVVNEGGGDKKPSDFTITVSGNNPTPSSFAGSSSGTTVTLNPGRYSVTENLLSGYTSSMSGDCSGTIDNTGETNECTITNVYQPEDTSAQLIVITNVIDNNNNDDDSEPVRKPSAFTITVNGNDPLPRSFPGKSGLGVIVNLDPGRYSITEKGPSGYTIDYSDGCQGTISAGEAKACIITNESIMPPQPIPSPVPPQPSQPLPVIETITGFSAPYGIASSLDNDLIYVSNFGQFNVTGTVSAINGTTNTIVTTIYVDKNPQAIAYNSANGLFYVANTYSNTLSIINGTTNSLIGSIPVGDVPGKSPTGIAVNSVNNTVYVTNMGSNTISVINGTTNVVVGNITSGMGGSFFSPTGIAYNSDNDNLYVTNRGSDTVSVINSTTNMLIDEIPIDAIAPSGIIYNAANNYVYVTNMGSNTVSVINGTTNALVETIPVGLGPNGITYNQNNGDVYVANSINGTISVISGLTNTVYNTIPIGINNNPIGVSYDPTTNTLFATNSNSNTVSAVKNQ
ncbi:MAG TPA: beta-propeller fold lactonase family protein [Nitrososphaeraceae archaeon]